MTDHANAETQPQTSRMRERFALLDLIGRLDDAIYSVERVFVTAALVIMTMASFLKIFADYLSKASPSNPTPLIITLAVVFVAFSIIGRVSAGTSPAIKGNTLMMNLVSLIWGVSGVVYTWLVHASTFSPQRIARQVDGVTAAANLSLYHRLVGLINTQIIVDIHVSIAMLILLYFVFRKPRPADEPTWTFKTVFQIVLIFVAWAFGFWVGAFYGRTATYTYTWGSQLSLLLLLWMAFIGASMATHRREHLSIDAIRKLIPAKMTRGFNACSFLIAAVFTFAFFYLSCYYLGLRLQSASHVPGRVPDWVGVLAIPVALGLVTVRFAAYAMADILGAVLKIEPDPEKDVTEVAS